MRAFLRAGECWLGLFIMANALGELAVPGFGLDELWIGATWMPAALRIPTTAGLGLALVLPRTAEGFRARATVALAAFFAGLALSDAVGYWRLLATRVLFDGSWLCSSLLVAAVLLSRAFLTPPPAVSRPPVAPACPERASAIRRVPRIAVSLLSLAAWSVAFPLALLLAHGTTDYRRPADAIVIYGAGIFPDGTPSLTLTDRVDTGVSLYREGWAPKMVMTGGIDRYGRSEPRVMADRAAVAGVPREDLILDESGRNTEASVRFLREISHARGWRRTLSVSHYFHNLRIRFAARRIGVETCTVPARMTRRLSKEPWFVLREVAAFYAYFLTMG